MRYCCTLQLVVSTTFYLGGATIDWDRRNSSGEVTSDADSNLVPTSSRSKQGGISGTERSFVIVCMHCGSRSYLLEN